MRVSERRLEHPDHKIVAHGRRTMEYRHDHGHRHVEISKVETGAGLTELLHQRLLSKGGRIQSRGGSGLHHKLLSKFSNMNLI